jgi:hypothetical protein
MNFSSALQIALEHTSVPLLYSLSGVRYADHLAATGHIDQAVEVIRSNLEFCTDQGWRSDAALCLAQLAAIDPAPLDEALQRADDAIRMARTIGAKQTLAESLLVHAEIAQKSGRLETARTDLSEVLSQAQQAGYRILEADARIMLGSVRQGQQEFVAARAEAQLAEQLSHALDYTRGARRARTLLNKIIGN